MMKISNILVPTDFSENAYVAFKTAYRLACAMNASLELLHVREDYLRTAVKEEIYRSGWTKTATVQAVLELEEAHFHEMLAGLDPKVPIRTTTVQGRPEDCIVTHAKETGADLMAVGLRGAGIANALHTAVLGSVAETMIRKSPCPVLVVRLDHESGAG